ncbi:MAG: transporter [Proteobacteria bacterium]|nr:transporter [Pseudomonadota bacterium]
MGQAVSILGSWMQQVALGWLVYRLSGSAMLLGATAFLAQIPQLFVAPLAGIVIDRSNIRRLMLLVQSGMCLQALGLAAITHYGWVEPWHLLLGAAVFGVLNSFDVPLRHAYTSQLLSDRRDLPNAIALNSLFFNMARFVGPPLAGVILTLSSEALCFALNGLSFVAILLVLLILRTTSAAHSSAGFREAMVEGGRYIRGSFPVRHILWQVALLNFLAANYLPLMPAFARDVFAGGPATLGALLGSAGAGALFASLGLAARPTVRGLSGAITNGNLLAGLALLAFALSGNERLAQLMLFLLGFGLINGNASSNTILQTILPEHLRGRVLAVYSAANLGAAALGGLCSGALAEHLGPGPTLLALACVLIGAALFFRLRLELFRMHLRPIYARLGIKRQTVPGKDRS